MRLGRCGLDGGSSSRPYCSAAAAVIITGVLFALMHASNPGANRPGLVFTAVGGILMGWLVIRSGSLWLLIGYHFGWNAAASALFGLELSGFEQNASVVSMTLSGPDWLTGGSYGFEASLIVVLCEIATLWIARRCIRPKRTDPPTPGDRVQD